MIGDVLNYRVVGMSPRTTLEECDTFLLGEFHNSWAMRQLNDRLIANLATRKSVVLLESQESLGSCSEKGKDFIPSSPHLSCWGWDIGEKEYIMSDPERYASEIIGMAMKCNQDWLQLESTAYEIISDLKSFHEFPELQQRVMQKIHCMIGFIAIEADRDFTTSIGKKVIKQLEASAAREWKIIESQFPFRTSSMLHTLDHLPLDARSFLIAGMDHLDISRKLPAGHPESLAPLKDYIKKSPRKIAILIPYCEEEAIGWLNQHLFIDELERMTHRVKTGLSLLKEKVVSFETLQEEIGRDIDLGSTKGIKINLMEAEKNRVLFQKIINSLMSFTEETEKLIKKSLDDAILGDKDMKFSAAGSLLLKRHHECGQLKLQLHSIKLKIESLKRPIETIGMLLEIEGLEEEIGIELKDLDKKRLEIILAINALNMEGYTHTFSIEKI